MTDREYILLLLKENPSLTQVELSEMMDKSRRTVQMLMKELLDEGTIERIGSKKKGSWPVLITTPLLTLVNEKWYNKPQK